VLGGYSVWPARVAAFGGTKTGTGTGTIGTGSGGS